MPAAHAPVDAGLFQSPDVSETHTTFACGGDIWIVPKTGDAAPRPMTPHTQKTRRAQETVVRK